LILLHYLIPYLFLCKDMYYFLIMSILFIDNSLAVSS